MAASTTSRTRPWYDNRTFKALVATGPVLKWGIVAVSFTITLYLYQRDLNVAQGANLLDLKRDLEATKMTVERNRDERDRQIEEIKKSMLTREVFEAYHDGDQQRMQRMEKLMEQMIERPPR